MKVLLFFLFPLLLLSCKNNSSKKQQQQKKPAMSIVQQHNTVVVLESNIAKKIQDWKFYNAFEKKIELYHSISANEALNNAIDLSQAITRLKNNKKPKELSTNSFLTRIDVLENEIFRLKDMTFIPTITAVAVNKQVDKILAAFAATNSKINAVFATLQVEKEIEIKS